MDLLFAMAPSGGDGGGSMVSTIIMFGAIFAIFYFMIIRPQQKKAKERDGMITELKKGDKIITSGGVHATIAGIEDKTILVDVGGNVKMKLEKTAIGSVINNKEEK